MKLLILFSIFFALICFIQADDITLRILLSHNQKPKEIGEIKGFLVGKNEKKEFSFGKTLLLNNHPFIIDTNFPEEIEKILIQTKEELPPGVVFHHIAMLSNFNKGYTLFDSEVKSFNRGETISFIENFKTLRK